MKISMIAAMAHDRVIGLDNQMPWHLPADLAHFKRVTLGKPVLMGRKTAESLGRALPKRRNLVLTRGGQAPFDGMEAVASLDEALRIARIDGADTLAVIGGGEVYALALPLADRMHLTWVDAEVADADAFFPRLDADGWRVVARDAHPADARHPHAFEFVDYLRA